LIFKLFFYKKFTFQSKLFPRIFLLRQTYSNSIYIIYKNRTDLWAIQFNTFARPINIPRKSL